MIARFVLTLVMLAPFGMLWGASSEHDKRFGKTLLVEHRLPDAKIRKLNAFKPSAPVQGESKIVNAMLADTEDWIGPELSARSGSNPYTVAVLITGVAKADGDAATLWHSGWRIETKEHGEHVRMNPLPGLAKTGAKAGETLRLAAAASTSFKEDRKAAPAVGMVNTRNIEIQEVRVQVWTGASDSTVWEAILSFRWALIGLVLIVLWWFGFRRSRA